MRMLSNSKKRLQHFKIKRDKNEEWTIKRKIRFLKWEQVTNSKKQVLTFRHHNDAINHVNENFKHPDFVNYHQIYL